MADTLNWPVLAKYCGCCGLNTGIIVVGVIKIIFLGFLLWADTSILVDVVVISLEAHETETWVVSDVVTGRRTCTNDTLLRMYYLLMINHIIWIVMELAIVVTAVLLIYGVWRKKPKLLKFYIEVNVPIWILAIIYAALNVLMLDIDSKLLVLLFGFIIGYHLLAVRSAYRVFTGKSRFYKETNLNAEISFDQRTTVNEEARVQPPRYLHIDVNRNHCTTCACRYRVRNVGTSPPEPLGLAPVQEIQNNLRLPINVNVNRGQTNKELNVRESPSAFISPPNIVSSRVVTNGGVVGGSRAPHVMTIASRPSTLPCLNQIYTSTIKDGEKLEINDNPVIYDEEQLNMGRSPIIEERKDENSYLM